VNTAWRQKAKRTSILDGDAPLCIEPGRLTLPAMLRQAGYQTAWSANGISVSATADSRGFQWRSQTRPARNRLSIIATSSRHRRSRAERVDRKSQGAEPRSADPIQVSYITNISDESTVWSVPIC